VYLLVFKEGVFLVVLSFGVGFLCSVVYLVYTLFE
jgi:hypothetical protein